MLKLQVRENMKNISRFLLVALALCGVNAYAAAPVPTTVGSNLTAFNGNSGATNNAMWNSYMNPRANSATTTTPTADFGNCNAIILRCAQPKCANGGCSSLEIARPIVSGCVESNSSCKQYGDDLIEYISAQLVADSNAAAQQAAADAQVAAANAAAQQSAQQMAQMQQQMSQMQQQMQQQSADTAAQIQAALAQQQQATSQAIADAAAASSAATVASMPTQQSNASVSGTATTSTAMTSTANTSGLTTAQQLAAASGISADLLAREQISGQILTKIENAEVALKSAKAAMDTAFAYAGCNSSGSNCTGPKRVSTFKNKAMEFFEPYNDVLDEVYDALILAQSVGVDITDIYMMLNGTCNAWGQYLCAEGQVMHYNANNCPDGTSVPVETNGGVVYGGADCKIGQVVPMSDGGCQLIKVLEDDAEVQRNWLYPETGEGGVQVRVGCASEILDNSTLFRNRRGQASIDIDTLQRIIEQDAPSAYGSNGIFGGTTTPENDGLPYCTLNETTYRDLQKIAALKDLPDKVCVTESEMKKIAKNGTLIAQTNSESVAGYYQQCSAVRGVELAKCLCNAKTGVWHEWDEETKSCVCFKHGPETETFDYNKLECVSADDNTADDVSDVSLGAGSTTSSNSGYFSWIQKTDPFGVQATLTDWQNTAEANEINTRFGYCLTYGGTWDKESNSCDCSGTGDNFVSCLTNAK